MYVPLEDGFPARSSCGVEVLARVLGSRASVAGRSIPRGSRARARPRHPADLVGASSPRTAIASTPATGFGSIPVDRASKLAQRDGLLARAGLPRQHARPQPVRSTRSSACARRLDRAAAGLPLRVVARAHAGRVDRRLRLDEVPRCRPTRRRATSSSTRRRGMPIASGASKPSGATAEPPPSSVLRSTSSRGGSSRSPSSSRSACPASRSSRTTPSC